MQAALIKQGWLRALVFLILMLGAAMGADILFSSFFAPSIHDSFMRFSASYLMVAVAWLLLTWMVTKLLDKTRFFSTGFLWLPYRADAIIGLCTAGVMLGIGTLALLLTNALVLLPTDNTGNLPLMFLLMVVVAVVEELVFRGYILSNLMASMNKWIALIVSAVVFAVFHAVNPDVSLLPIVNVFLAGILLGCNYIFTRNLWFAVMFHFGWNFIQGAILGYNVSGIDTPSILQQLLPGSAFWTGGSFGFEGSFACTLLLLFTSIIWLYLFAHKYRQVQIT